MYNLLINKHSTSIWFGIKVYQSHLDALKLSGWEVITINNELGKFIIEKIGLNEGFINRHQQIS